jgi:hypothetical protein
MGKEKAAVIAVFGVIIFLVGLGTAGGVIAANVGLIAAGPLLILAVILMAIGVYLINKAKGRWDRAATAPKQSWFEEHNGKKIMYVRD